MRDWDDLTDRTMAICRDTFGSPVSYSASSGEVFDTVGIFDAAYKSIELLDGVAIQSVNPSLGIRMADFPVRPTAGDFVTVKNKTYRVIDFMPDGQAGATLKLEAATL